MNILHLVFGKCQNIEKDSLINFYKKNSKTSLEIIDKGNPNEEILSNESTNNLEIIDYPYSNDLGEEYNFPVTNIHNNLNTNNFQDNYNINTNNNDTIKNMFNENSNNDNILNNRYRNNSLNSLNGSSDIISNEDNLKHNKALLSLYNHFKNKEPIKKINNNETNFKNIFSKFGTKIEISSPDTDTFLSKKSNKSKCPKEKNSKIKINLKKSNILGKCNTNFVSFRNKTNNKLGKNKTTNNLKSLNVNQNNKKREIIHVSKITNYKMNIFKKKKNNLSIMNKLQKNLIHGKKSINKSISKIFKNISVCNYNTNISINKTKTISRNDTSNYKESKGNSLNYSYLWINNKDNHFKSNTISNPFN